MIEQTIYDYLNSGVISVKAYLQQPRNNKHPDTPQRYVVIERTGGGESNLIKQATIAIQSYGDSMYEAASLNEEVKEAMRNIVTLDEVSRCHLNSDYNFTDLETKKYRYQAVFDLVHY